MAEEAIVHNTGWCERLNSNDIAHLEKMINKYEHEPYKLIEFNITWMTRALATMRQGIIPAINQTNSRTLTEAPT